MWIIREQRAFIIGLEREKILQGSEVSVNTKSTECLFTVGLSFEGHDEKGSKSGKSEKEGDWRESTE